MHYKILLGTVLGNTISVAILQLNEGILNVKKCLNWIFSL